MGIDYGSKRVGIALSDDGGMLAFPKRNLTNDRTLFDEIKKTCKTEEVDAIVLGESLDFAGEPNKIMEKIVNFKQKLETELNLPVYLQKEFMTSVEARRPKDGKNIFSARKLPQEKPKEVDASAAALILQRYLDKIINKVDSE